MDVMQKPWEDLANAIILRAVDDYRIAAKKLQKDPENFQAQDEIKSVERFFHSAWYEMLTDVDGDMILRKLRWDAAKLQKTKNDKNSQSKG